MIPDPDQELIDFVNMIDDAILEYRDMGDANLAGALLSRVVLLTQNEPSVGKGLVKFVWEKLDQIEQSRPGDYL